jgi:hypothetical protein
MKLPMLDFSRPATALLHCMVCNEQAMAMHAISETLRFAQDLADGKLLCECGGQLQRASKSGLLNAEGKPL